MKNMDEYYASPIASTDFLMHYGVKGMKWGVRKALERGDVKALRRHQIKALKKLTKLNKMAVSGKKYAAKAAAYGTGAALAGGAAIAGSKNISGLVGKLSGVYSKRATSALQSLSSNGSAYSAKALEALSKKAPDIETKQKAASALSDFIKNDNAAKNLANASRNIRSLNRENLVIKLPDLTPKKKYDAADVRKLMESASPLKPGNAGGSLKLVSNSNGTKTLQRSPGINYSKGNTVVTDDLKGLTKIGNKDAIVRVGLGAAALGLGAAAARNAYKAKHGDKYRRKAQEFERAMNETFGSIDYSKLQPRKKRRQ